jgi:hypothetical protein
VGPRLTNLLCKKNIVAKSKQVKTRCNPAEYYKEDCCSKRVVFPMMMMTKKKKKEYNFMITELATPNTIINLCNFFARLWIK